MVDILMNLVYFGVGLWKGVDRFGVYVLYFFLVIIFIEVKIRNGWDL